MTSSQKLTFQMTRDEQLPIHHLNCQDALLEMYRLPPLPEQIESRIESYLGSENTHYDNSHPKTCAASNIIRI